MTRIMLALLCAAVLAAGCKSAPPACDEETGEGCPPAEPLADACNSLSEALTQSACALTLGTARSAYLSFSGDDDWYSARLPPGLTGRSLLHLSGGYNAPSTAVNLALSLLREDGAHSLARKVDQHGQKPPGLVDIILPFAESSARLVVRVSDEGAGLHPNFDVRSPYQVALEVVENPDVNEPNDEAPKDLGAGATARATGYLATDNDIDRFSFTVSGAGRKILHLKLSADRLSPPPAYQLSYLLSDPAGKPVAEGVARNPYIATELATARLVSPGAYTIVVRGDPGDGAAPVPGDLRLAYSLELKVLDDVDVNEPNDAMAQARLISVGGAPGGLAQVEGRLSYVPDPDWYAVDLPASAAASVLRVKVSPGAGGGRFPALPGPLDRGLRVVTLASTQADCRDKPAVCPKGYDGRPNVQGLVEELCGQSPPQCLWTARNEHPAFPNLRNLEAVLPVPAHATTLRYLILVQDEGNDFADDKDYALSVRWLADADETARAALPNQTDTAELASQGAGFPVPPATGERSGELTYGYGRVVNDDVNQGQGVRGPEDYDAVPSDSDRFEFVFPAGQTAPFDRTWSLQWEFAREDGGVPPSDIALDLEFCAGDGDGGSSCASSGGMALGYSGERRAPWYSNALEDRQVLWDRQVTATSVIVTAQPVGCFCFEPRFVLGGRFFVNVLATDRQSHEPTRYKLRAAFSSYPESYTADGGNRSCPEIPDGGVGCRFTGLP